MRLLAIASLCSIFVACTEPANLRYGSNLKDPMDGQSNKVTSSEEGDDILKEGVESGEAASSAASEEGDKRYSMIYKDLTGTLGFGPRIVGVFGKSNPDGSGVAGVANLIPAPELPCDFDFNGFVDGEDLEIWKNGYGLNFGATSSNGDCNGDAAVNGLDFLMWQRNFGRSIFDFEITAPLSEVVTRTPTIEWESSFGSFGYQVDIASDSACLNIIQSEYVPDDGFSTVYSHQIDPVDNGTYYICVYADNPSASNAAAEASLNTVPTYLAARNNPVTLVVNAPIEYEHIVFVTNTTFTVSGSAEPNPGLSNFGGLSSADLQCTRKANAAGLLSGWNGTDRIYKALISTASENANNRLVIEGRLINRAGQVVAEDANQFWNGILSNPITYNEFGTALAANTPFWTGSTAQGFLSQNCNNWTQTVGLNANVGTNSATSNWFNQGAQSCGVGKRLVCVGPAQIQAD